MASRNPLCSQHWVLTAHSRFFLPGSVLSGPALPHRVDRGRRSMAESPPEEFGPHMMDALLACTRFPLRSATDTGQLFQLVSMELPTISTNLDW